MPVYRDGRVNRKLESDFFGLISRECNYIDPDFVKLFYFSFFTTITQELHKNGSVHLPYLGDLAIVKEAPRWRWKGRQHVKEAREVLRFYPKRRLKRSLTL